MAREMIYQGDTYYSGDGWTLKREFGKFHGWWVLRDHAGEMISFKQYRNDFPDIVLRGNEYTK